MPTSGCWHLRPWVDQPSNRPRSNCYVARGVNLVGPATAPVLQRPVHPHPICRCDRHWSCGVVGLRTIDAIYIAALEATLPTLRWGLLLLSTREQP